MFELFPSSKTINNFWAIGQQLYEYVENKSTLREFLCNNEDENTNELKSFLKHLISELEEDI